MLRVLSFGLDAGDTEDLLRHYHYKATLPRILAEGSGLIILASVMTMLGSAFLAFPTEFHLAASRLADAIQLLAANADLQLTAWISGITRDAQ